MLPEGDTRQRRREAWSSVAIESADGTEKSRTAKVVLQSRNVDRPAANVDRLWRLNFVVFWGLTGWVGVKVRAVLGVWRLR